MTLGTVMLSAGRIIVEGDSYNFTDDVVRGSIKNHMEVEVDMVNGKITAIYGPEVRTKKQKEEMNTKDEEQNNKNSGEKRRKRNGEKQNRRRKIKSNERARIEKVIS